MDWATFWVISSQTHLVTLLALQLQQGQPKVMRSRDFIVHRTALHFDPFMTNKMIHIRACFFKLTPLPSRDSISRPIAQVSSVESGDTRPRRRAMLKQFVFVPHLPRHETSYSGVDV
jgi:hypothetical protein